MECFVLQEDLVLRHKRCYECVKGSDVWWTTDVLYSILIKHYGRKSNEKKQENATWQKKTKGRKSQTKTFVEKHRRTFAKKANTVNILMVRLLIGSCRGSLRTNIKVSAICDVSAWFESILSNNLKIFNYVY